MESIKESVRKETIEVSATKVPKRKNGHRHPFFPHNRELKRLRILRQERVPQGRSPSEKLTRKTRQEYMHGKCTKPPCDFSPNVSIPKNRRHAGSAITVLSGTSMLKDIPVKDRKRTVMKVLLLFGRIHDSWVAYQDVDPNKFSSIILKSTTVSRPTRTVQLSKISLRLNKIRGNNGPSLGVTQRTSPHDHSPYVPKFEDLSQEETERQEWRMEKGVLKLEGTDQATLFSTTVFWCFPAPSVIKLEEDLLCQCTCGAERIQFRLNLETH